MRKKLNKLRYSTNTKREKIAALMREYEKGMVNDKFRTISEVLVTKSHFNFNRFSQATGTPFAFVVISQSCSFHFCCVSTRNFMILTQKRKLGENVEL